MGEWYSVPKLILRHYLTKNRAEICMSVCGLVALVTPLLLWVSWSKEMLKLVLAMGFAAFLLATFFAQYACPEAVEPEENDIPKPEDLPIKVEGQLTVSRQAEKGWRNRS